MNEVVLDKSKIWEKSFFDSVRTLDFFNQSLSNT